MCVSARRGSVNKKIKINQNVAPYCIPRFEMNNANIIKRNVIFYLLRYVLNRNIGIKHFLYFIYLHIPLLGLVKQNTFINYIYLVAGYIEFSISRAQVNFPDWVRPRGDVGTGSKKLIN